MESLYVVFVTALESIKILDFGLNSDVHCLASPGHIYNNEYYNSL